MIHGMMMGSTVLFLATICAAQQVEIKKVPIQNIAPNSGEKMYMSYCAACHGTNGRGAGPAASALKKPPSDLTLLARANGGTFPALQVFHSITGDTAMPAAHGTKDMPVWKPLLTSLTYGARTGHAEVHLRVSNLTDYIKSIQQN
jgi:mono/diheme cytochrome c family protein